jgi:hypothetical protein
VVIEIPHSSKYLFAMLLKFHAKIRKRACR